MHKLFRYHLVYLCSSHKKFYATPKFFLPFSQLHTFHTNQGTNSKIDYVFNEVDALNSSCSKKPLAKKLSKTNEVSGQRQSIKDEKSMVKISHPWPEWVDLMVLLLKRSYFETNGNPFINGELGNKEKNWIRTACLNFGRDHFGLLRFLSRKDIRVIVGFGCPSIDRKVVNSGKRLRAHVGVDEGNVCSSCKLRGDCERAYVKAREDEVGRTLDVMRILLTYGLDSIAVENKPVQNKMVTDSVRILLKELVEYSSQQYDSDFPDGNSSNTDASQNNSNVLMKQGDWLCPKCNFLNFARNIRCLRCDGFSEERLKRLHEDQYDLPLKKGDWICQKCNFLNFAKNTSCLQCKEKPTNRRINPGEWECESCNYINFRRNMVCLKCDYRRLKALNAPNNSSTQTDRAAYPNERRTRFAHDEIEARNDKSIGPDRINQRRHVDMWRFVEEDIEDDSNENSGFLDFPILGGKSSLSQDTEKRERWKLEMLEKNKTSARMNGSAEEPRSPGTQRTCKYLETTDDDEEDMAEWFGHAKEME